MRPCKAATSEPKRLKWSRVCSPLDPPATIICGLSGSIALPTRYVQAFDLLPSCHRHAQTREIGPVPQVKYRHAMPYALPASKTVGKLRSFQLAGVCIIEANTKER